MKKHYLYFMFACVLLLMACSKSSLTRHRVFIRVKNATAERFSNFDFNRVDFGSIEDGDTSIYHPVWNVLPLAFSNEIFINNQGTYIIDVVPTPYLTEGRYLLQMMVDTLPYKYKADIIKEQ